MRQYNFYQYIFWTLSVAIGGLLLGFFLFNISTRVFLFIVGPLEPTSMVVTTPVQIRAEMHFKRPVPVPKLSISDLQKIESTIKAKAYLVKDLDDNSNLIMRGSGNKFPIASVTKLVTAMVTMDNLRGDEIVQISKKAVSTTGRQGNLSAGERLKVVDLLNCLLLESSNDAAEALAEKLGREKFLSLMNIMAGEIGMLSTKFSDPSGLSALNTSTSDDLSRLIEYIEKSRPDVMSITTRQSYKVIGGTASRNHFWLNRNRLVRDDNDYYIGGKDGFTSDALMTFVGVFSVRLTQFDHKKFSIALLRSSDRNGDVDKIINGIVNALKYEDGSSLQGVLKKQKLEGEAERNLTLMFVGDIMMDRGVRQMIDTHGNGDFSFPFEFVPFLKDPDILFANLEGPVSDLGYDIGSIYSFRMDSKTIPALVAAGFDAVSLANNHIGDWGLTAFEDTLNRLRSSNILAIGAGYNAADARTVKVIEKNGIKIGFLGFSDVGPTWLMQNRDLPSILSASDPEIKSIISDAAKIVDHLVVSFHFGEEYIKEITQRQRYLAHMAIDARARVVVGHHPHVVGEVERYNNGLIAYSLGNFIFDQPFSKETMTGSVLEVILDKKDLLEVNESEVTQNSYFQPRLIEGSGR